MKKIECYNKAFELFPMFQAFGDEGIEDVVNRCVPELQKWINKREREIRNEIRNNVR
jgi:hypothetical protein